jgi:hypothetical protein
MPVLSTAIKNFPSNRGSRANRAREHTCQSKLIVLAFATQDLPGNLPPSLTELEVYSILRFALDVFGHPLHCSHVALLHPQPVIIPPRKLGCRTLRFSGCGFPVNCQHHSSLLQPPSYSHGRTAELAALPGICFVFLASPACRLPAVLLSPAGTLEFSPARFGCLCRTSAG